MDIVDSNTTDYHKKLLDFISLLNRNKILSDQNQQAQILDIQPPVLRMPLFSRSILYSGDSITHIHRSDYFGHQSEIHDMWNA